MMSTWIAIREVIPWLTPVPYFLDPDDQSRLRSGLRAAGFKVFEADASDCTDEKELLDAVGNAMPFADYFGHNWDAFDDCLGDLQRERFGPLALIVTSADRLLRSDPHAFVRSVHLLQVTVELVAASGDKGFQFEVFFVGHLGAAPTT